MWELFVENLGVVVALLGLCVTLAGAVIGYFTAVYFRMGRNAALFDELNRELQTISRQCWEHERRISRLEGPTAKAR